MSLRTLFRAGDLEELAGRVARLDRAKPERWLDRFPELWLAEGARWSVEDSTLWLYDAQDLRRDHSGELLHGEPGAWSYLCVSTLLRALGRLAAGQQPQPWLERAPDGLEWAAGLEPSQRPEEWRPCVVEDNTRVTVTGHLRQGRGVFQLEDRYASEGFDFDTRTLLLGRVVAG